MSQCISAEIVDMLATFGIVFFTLGCLINCLAFSVPVIHTVDHLYTLCYQQSHKNRGSDRENDVLNSS